MNEKPSCNLIGWGILIPCKQKQFDVKSIPEELYNNENSEFAVLCSDESTLTGDVFITSHFSYEILPGSDVRGGATPVTKAIANIEKPSHEDILYLVNEFKPYIENHPGLDLSVKMYLFSFVYQNDTKAKDISKKNKFRVVIN